LQQQLRAQDDLLSQALLLLRYTGMRIGELLNLPTDALRHLGGEQRALHVPLAKLHTERWVPVDHEIRQLYARILVLRQERATAASSNLLLPLPHGYGSRLARALRLEKGSTSARCSRQSPPHQLRHSYATEMLRAGASLPGVMNLLGHKAINMTFPGGGWRGYDPSHGLAVADGHVAIAAACSLENVESRMKVVLTVRVTDKACRTELRS
jgi:site-specific recombinase XerD